MKTFRLFLSRHVPVIFSFLKFMRLLFDSSSFIHTEGIWMSWCLDRPVNAEGTAVPWVNISVRRLFEERLKNNFRLLEFGAGNSTTYFKERVKEIITVEHSAPWARNLQENLSSNQIILLTSPDSPEQYLLNVGSNTLGKFQVIFIDGIFRYECCLKALEMLSVDGIVILDDSARDEYSSCHMMFREEGFKALRISGIKPCGYLVDETTLFYREGNCFDL